MNSILKSLKTLLLGIAAFCFCLVLYNTAVWLPVHLDTRFWPDYLVENVFFYFPAFFRGLRSESDRLISQVWEVFVAPALIVMAGALAVPRLKGRFKIVVPDLILLSSFSLMSFLVGLVANDLSHWFGDPTEQSRGLNALRISLSVFVALWIVIPTFLAFYRLHQGLDGSWPRGLISFVCRFFIPSAIVTLFAVLQVANIWSPFHRSPPRWEWMTFDGWQLIFLPVISIGMLATLSAIFAPRLLSWSHSSGFMRWLRHE
jgi:hypothetical protein